MTAEEAFLQAIIDNPKDDTPRLIFADWLEEHGQPVRADFIRVQIHLARLPEHDPRHQELRERSQQLQESCREWLGPLAELESMVHFWRGFVEGIDTDVDTYLRHAEALARLTPLRHLELGRGNSDIAGTFTQLNACPHLNRIKTIGLEFGCYFVHDTDLEALAQLPLLLERLSSLFAVECEVSAVGLRALLLSPHLSRLQSLTLFECQLSGVEGVRPLIESAQLSCLTSLSLADNRLGDEAIRLLVSSLNCRRLTSLNLDECDVGDDGAVVLAQSPHLARLSFLSLGNNQIRNRGASALARSPLLPSLKWLSLMDNRIGDAGAGAFATSPYCGGLETLILDRNRFSAARKKHLKIRFGNRVFF